MRAGRRYRPRRRVGCTGLDFLPGAVSARCKASWASPDGKEAVGPVPARSGGNDNQPSGRYLVVPVVRAPAER